MTYLRYQQLKPLDPRRFCEVHHQKFTRMVAVLEEEQRIEEARVTK